MTERADQPATPEIPHGVPGKALAAQREAMGWSVEQVADQLKLAVRQVVALEAGDYAALPSPAVVRGFVRAYAKILKLDAAPLVAMIELDTAPPESAANPPRAQKPATFSESRFPSHAKRGGLPLGLIGAAVALAAAAAAWHFGLLPLPNSGEQASAGTAASTVVLPAPESASAAVVAAPAAEPAPQSAVPLIIDPSVAPVAAQPPATAPVVAAPVVAAPVVTAPAAPAAGANALVLDVREDSWIQVRTANGEKTLVSRLVKAGSTETVEVTEPVNVLVGNPAGVSATLRGAAVALPVVPGKTVSRVSLK